LWKRLGEKFVSLQCLLFSAGKGLWEWRIWFFSTSKPPNIHCTGLASPRSVLRFFFGQALSFTLWSCFHRQPVSLGFGGKEQAQRKAIAKIDHPMHYLAKQRLSQMFAMSEVGESVIVIKRSKQAMRDNLIAFVLFFLLACGFTTYHRWYWLSCLSILFFGWGIFMGLRSRRDDQPQIIINPAGIELFGVGYLSWDSIKSIWPEYYRHVCIIVFELQSGQRIRFPASDLEILCGDIRAQIEQQIARVQTEKAQAEADSNQTEIVD